MTKTKTKRVVRSRSHLYRSVGALLRGEVMACSRSADYNKFPNTVAGRRAAFAMDQKTKTGHEDAFFVAVMLNSAMRIGGVDTNPALKLDTTFDLGGGRPLTFEGRPLTFENLNAAMTYVLTQPNRYHDAYLRRRAQGVV